MAQRPDGAIAALRRIHEQVGNDKSIAEAIDGAICQFEQLPKIGMPIRRIFRLPSEGSNLAEHYYYRRYFATSAAISWGGFTSSPSLVEDIQAQNRYNAACSAALAAFGEGIEKPPLDQEAKASWRRQALAWLKADLAYWSKQTETGLPDRKARVRQTLERWKADRDLTSLREPDARANLPDAEEKDWQAFWAEVLSLLNKADQH